MTDQQSEDQPAPKTADRAPFIVDNSTEESSGISYLKDWCGLSSSIDIATGNFEIGALLALDEAWQKLDRLRILIGGATSQTTYDAILRAEKALESSFEPARKADLFLTGVEAVVEALQTGQIEIRVYTARKFHAKAYITHGRNRRIGSSALVGSSNLSRPGLETNVELNVHFGGAEVRDLQDWFAEHWETAKPATAELLTLTQRQTAPVTPFEVYAKSLQVLTQDVELGDLEWETNVSQVIPKLDPYQLEGYHALKAMARRQRGGFLTDGVGMGKTFVGLALAEYYAQRERLNVLILATKTGRDAVWNPDIKEYLPDLHEDEYTSLHVRAHTDLSGVKADPLTERLAKRADVIIVDEAHNFRNRGTAATDEDPKRSRWFRLQEICQGKMVFLLTATPVNNGLLDLLHQIQLFTGDDDQYFKEQLKIPSLRRRIIDLERNFVAEDAGDDQAADGVRSVETVTMENFTDLMDKDPLLPAVIRQCSRKYAIESTKAAGKGEVLFPETAMPAVVDYNLTIESDQLLDELDKAFSKKEPLFTLPMYYPLAYWIGDPELVDSTKENRQRQVVGLIRTTFLKRFDSSIAAFAGSCVDLAAKIMSWMYANATDAQSRAAVEQWRAANVADFQKVQDVFLKRPDGLPAVFDDASIPSDGDTESEEDTTEEDTTDAEIDLLDLTDHLGPENYNLPEMFKSAYDDLDQIHTLVEKIMNVQAGGDDKYRQLAELLGAAKAKNAKPADKAFARDKVLIFSEYADTARYLARRLKEDGLAGVECLDGSMSRARTPPD